MFYSSGATCALRLATGMLRVYVCSLPNLSGNKTDVHAIETFMAAHHLRKPTKFELKLESFDESLASIQEATKVYVVQVNGSQGCFLCHT